MNSISTEHMKARILMKLARNNKWCHSHTAFETMFGGLATSQRGEARKAAEELIREGLIRVKPAFYGRQVSLNVERSDEIKALVRRYFGKSII